MTKRNTAQWMRHVSEILEEDSKGKSEYEDIIMPKRMSKSIASKINDDQLFTAERYVDLFERDIASVHLRSITMRAANDCRAQNIVISQTRAGRYISVVNLYPYHILNCVMRTGNYSY